jgi:hypothetical protein
MWLMEIRDEYGERWLKVSAITTAGYDNVSRIRAKLIHTQYQAGNFQNFLYLVQ